MLALLLPVLQESFRSKSKRREIVKKGRELRFGERDSSSSLSVQVERRKEKRKERTGRTTALIYRVHEVIYRSTIFPDHSLHQSPVPANRTHCPCDNPKPK